jgi:ATP-dependent exoDNAse (exonuclease V) beta subunit
MCRDVSEILVLTFTDAAAGEMQQRIAQNLKDASQKDEKSASSQTACNARQRRHKHNSLVLQRIIGQAFPPARLDPRSD